MLEQRIVYKLRKMNEPLTQGSIITNCLCDEFTCQKVWGCIITPRCDMSHSKVKTVHYLPIIDFEEWVKQYARPCLIEKWKKHLREKINNTLKNSSLNENVIDSLRLITREDLIRLGEEYIKGEKNISQFMENVEDLYSNNEPTDRFIKYVKSNDVAKHFVSQFVGYSNNHYYLIESWNKNDKSPFKVILLREIRRMKYEMSLRFAEGFMRDSFSDSELLSSDLCVTDEELYIAEADILSPYVEHILQHFSQNFTRIGVTDFSKENIDKINELLLLNL